MQPWETEEAHVVWSKAKNKEVAYFTWLRGALRQIWSDNPIRKQWKTSQLRPVTREEKATKAFHPSTKNVGECVKCREWFAGSKLECNHKLPSDGCKNYEEAGKFLHYCASGTGEDWELVCKPCHKIQTYAEREGISFEEARVTKEVIAIEKDKKVRQWYEDRGIVPESNAPKRRIQMVNYLLEGGE